MIIEHFSLELFPERYDGYPLPKLEIRVIINGLEHSYRKILYPNDLESRYDQIFEIAKKELKKEIIKGQEVEKTDSECNHIWVSSIGNPADLKCSVCGNFKR